LWGFVGFSDILNVRQEVAQEAQEMGDKETFESSLEREIFPHIEFICEVAPPRADEPEEDPQVFTETHMFNDVPITVELDLTGTGCSFRVYVDYELVYERSGGYTRTFRVGSWIERLVSKSMELCRERFLANLPRLIETDLERRSRFTPLAS
jgi:hypothetical protein